MYNTHMDQTVTPVTLALGDLGLFRLPSKHVAFIHTDAHIHTNKNHLKNKNKLKTKTKSSHHCILLFGCWLFGCFDGWLLWLVGFKTRFHSAVQARLELMVILLPQLPHCWDYK